MWLCCQVNVTGIAAAAAAGSSVARLAEPERVCNSSVHRSLRAGRAPAGLLLLLLLVLLLALQPQLLILLLPPILLLLLLLGIQVRLQLHVEASCRRLALLPRVTQARGRCCNCCPRSCLALVLRQVSPDAAVLRRPDNRVGCCSSSRSHRIPLRRPCSRAVLPAHMLLLLRLLLLVHTSASSSSTLAATVRQRERGRSNGWRDAWRPPGRLLQHALAGAHAHCYCYCPCLLLLMPMLHAAVVVLLMLLLATRGADCCPGIKQLQKILFRL
jgi:hypothetical protein